MFIAHGPFAYVANEALQGKKIKRLKFSKEVIIVFWSLFCGILPDFDLFLISLFGLPEFMHHDLITHTPIFYISLYILFLILYKIFFKFFNKKTREYFDKKFFKVLNNTFLIATLSHIFTDMLVGGVKILYPFSLKDFTILQNILPTNYFAGYYFSFFFAIEIVIIAVFFVALSRKFLEKQKWDEPVVYSLLSVSLLYFVFCIVMYSQTYNSGLSFDRNGEVTEDLDFDGIMDDEDADVDNNDINNINEAIFSNIYISADNIVNSGKIAIPQKDDLSFNEEILYKYGAFNSYRIISQAYFENALPIEPVIEKEVKNGMSEPSYKISYNPVDELYNYFKNRELLYSVNIQDASSVEPGKIFFVLNEDLEVENLGITLKDGNVAIVLPEDTKLHIHTFEEISEIYDMNTCLIQVQN